MVTKAQLKAQSKYDKENTKQIILKLNLVSDADVIAKLSGSTNKQGYLKALVRDDMRNNGEILSLDSIKYLLLPVVKKYGISSVCVFGSYARNEATAASDVDLLIEGGNYHGLIEYMTMIDAMKKALGKDVDVVTQSSLEQNNAESDLLFKNNIEKDRVVLI